MGEGGNGKLINRIFIHSFATDYFESHLLNMVYEQEFILCVHTGILLKKKGKYLSQRNSLKWLCVGYCKSIHSLASAVFNPLLHRYSFWHNHNRQLLKTLWEKKTLLVTSNFFFSHNVFFSIRKLYPYLSVFMTSYLYFPLNWKSLKLAYQVKC